MQKFEPDQLVLVKYGNGGPWRLRRYSFLDGDEHEMQDGSVWDDEHILPYSGNEHLLGATESPTPKWEPKPGELVAVSDTGEEDDWEACIYRGKSGSTSHPYRASRLNQGDRIAYTWKLCEPLRKHFTIPEE